MTLQELYEQQQNEIEQFKAFRDKVWDNLHKEQQQVSEAFGGKDRLPEDMQKRMETQINNYHQEWSIDGGDRHKTMVEHHEKQREELTGQPKQKQSQAKPGQKISKDQLSQKQAEMQKIIAQQQAMRKRQQEKKRSR